MKNAGYIDTLIPVIVGIMFQDLTVLHSVMVFHREKQGKNKNIKIKTHININTHLEVK